MTTTTPAPAPPTARRPRPNRGHRPGCTRPGWYLDTTPDGTPVKRCTHPGCTARRTIPADPAHPREDPPKENP